MEWPERRADVLWSLDTLAGEPKVGLGPDGSLLESAVHFLVDDTFWDVHDAAGSIGTILANDAEVEAVRPLVAAIVRVSDRQGATAPDEAWWADAEWPLVQRLAGEAAVLFHADQA